MYTKAKIFNLALGALLLQRQIVDTETETNNECAVLRTHYDVALQSALQEMNLDTTASDVILELLEADPVPEWSYAYRYPPKCAFFRRIKSGAESDNRTSRVPFRILVKDGVKTIYSNRSEAEAECIMFDLELQTLSAPAAMAIALKLACLSAPLVTGKGAAALMDKIEKQYAVTKMQAQALDRDENFNFVDDDVSSEFVEARLS